MPQYVRVADFEASEEGLERFLGMIRSEGGPPEGVPATAINVLANRETGKVRVAVFFASEEDLRRGSETLDSMSPSDDIGVRRVAVESFELALQFKAPYGA